MPRYYFDIENGDPYRDEIGEDLSDDQAAWRSALRLSRDIEERLAPGGTWRLQVSSQQQAPLFRSRSEANGLKQIRCPTMSRVTNRSWTPEQVERLQRFVKEGVSPSRASVVLKRTRQSVQNKARDIGSPFPRQQTLRAQRRAREAEALATIASEAAN